LGVKPSVPLSQFRIPQSAFRNPHFFPFSFSTLAFLISNFLYTGDVSASKIINELPKLTEAERQAILDKLRELAQVDDDRWEQIINEPMPRPKLKAFIERATAEGSEPLDLNRM
jgi:hypothetical protein